MKETVGDMWVYKRMGLYVCLCFDTLHMHI